MLDIAQKILSPEMKPDYLHELFTKYPDFDLLKNQTLFYNAQIIELNFYNMSGLLLYGYISLAVIALFGFSASVATIKSVRAARRAIDSLVDHWNNIKLYSNSCDSAKQIFIALPSIVA